MNPMIENFSIDEIEDSICQIDDIKAARIVVGPDMDIEEVHVLASTSKGPKQLSRDIESVLMARYGLPVNHRKISIAQLSGEDTKLSKARPKLISVKHEVFDRRATVSVTLQYSGSEYEGIEAGPASRMGRLRLVASATLKAVEKVAVGAHSFALEDITVINLGRDTVVITSIAILGAAGDEVFAGCAIVRDDEREAIVRSVLDAINRRLEFLIAK